jgi:tetratricopeptide (TPR) repeat protein
MSSRAARPSIAVPSIPLARGAWLLVGCAQLLVGCAPSTAAPAKDPTTAAAPIVVDEVRVTKTDPSDLPAIFDAASKAFLAGDYAAAASGFDRVHDLAPDGPSAASALYNGGLAYVEVGDATKSLERFLASAKKGPNEPTGVPALGRAARVLAYLEQWTDLERIARELLARTNLSVLERVEAQGSLALALVSQGRVDEAFEVIVKARDTIEEKQLGQSGTPPIQLAQVAFALGEIRRVKSEAIVFDPAPADFATTLELRCTGLLDAQSAYSDAMRSRDAHWSAMAGFRVGQLYQHLHRDVMKAPFPQGAKTTRQKQLWEGAMRLRYRVLLEKGLGMMAGTVAMAERTGERSEWVARARASQDELEDALAAEKEAMRRMPFTEDEMREALEQLKKPATPASAGASKPAKSR